MTPDDIAHWAQAIEKDPRLLAFTESDKDDKASIICALHGHAVVISSCFGQQTCNRCGEIVGDSLMGSGAKDKVLVAHDCEACHTTWAGAEFWGKLGVSPGGGGFLQKTSKAEGDKQAAVAAEIATVGRTTYLARLTENMSAERKLREARVERIDALIEEIKATDDADQYEVIYDKIVDVSKALGWELPPRGAADA